jgi:hypothetical protein
MQEIATLDNEQISREQSIRVCLIKVKLLCQREALDGKFISEWPAADDYQVSNLRHVHNRT